MFYRYLKIKKTNVVLTATCWLVNCRVAWWGSSLLLDSPILQTFPEPTQFATSRYGNHAIQW